MPLAAQDPPVARALPKVARFASEFWHSAPGYMATETLQQKAVTLPKRRLRVGSQALQPPKPEFQDREIVSRYALSSFQTTPEALHEFRQIVSVDGKRLLSADIAEERLLAALRAKDDKPKKALLDQFEKAGLAVAATDFGQLVLLFTKANLQKYTIESHISGLVGAERALVIAFHQSTGAESLRIREPGKQAKEPLAGQLWVRESDYLPLRITLNARRRDQSKEIRDEATVDYAPIRDGTLLPAAVVHRRFVNDQLLVENKYQYSAWQPVNAK